MKLNGAKDLAGNVARYQGMVDASAEAMRSKYVTPGAGQQQEYALTLAEANAALAASGSLAPSDYPMLSAELEAQKAVGNTTATLQSVASQTIKAYQDNTNSLATIKQVRRTAKMKIASSETIEEMEAIYLGLNWNIT